MLAMVGKQKQHENGGFRHFMVDLPRRSWLLPMRDALEGRFDAGRRRL
jgi:hypothetical protein